MRTKNIQSVALTFLAAWFATSLQADEFTLGVGEVKVIDARHLSRIVVGGSGVISHRLLNRNQLLVVAEAPGESTVNLWQADGSVIRHDVVVAKRQPSRNVREAQRILAAYPSLRISDVGGKPLIEGELTTAQKEAIGPLVAQIPSAILATTDQPFVFEQLVRMDVRIIEVRRRNLENLGVRWDAVINGPNVGLHTAWVSDDNYGNGNGAGADFGFPVTDSGSIAYAGWTTSMNSTIDLMAESGEARLISSPRLVAKNGETARFLSGGEYPIPMRGELGELEVVMQPYGVSLEFTPKLNAENQLNTAILAEVSNIDNAVEVNGVPGITTRRVESIVNVLPGQTLVISGLATSAQGSSVSKVPYLGGIPYLGALFRTQHDEADQLELVIFVTPVLVSSNDDTEQLKARANQMVSGTLHENINALLQEKDDEGATP